MDGNSEWLTRTGEIMAFIISVFGVNKLMGIGLTRRMTNIEKRQDAHPSRTVEDCEKLMVRCPANNQVADVVHRLEAMDKKFDRKFDDISKLIIEKLK